MKILGVVCSPRKGGNTEILVGECLSSARGLGAEVELLFIHGKNIAPCDGCASCRKTLKCKVEDDMQEIYPKLLEADGIIIGTPVYFWGMTGQAKVFIDRTYPLLEGRRLRNKVAGAVVVARRSGAAVVFNALHTFFNLHRMTSVGGAMGYAGDEEIVLEDRAGGVIAYASQRGDVRQDSRGMAEAQLLGKSMVKNIKALQGIKVS